MEYWGWTTICTDWYQYTNYDPTPVYLYTSCTNPQYGLVGTGIECTSGGGNDGENGGNTNGEDGGGGGYNPQLPPTPLHPKLQRIVNQIFMSNDQKTRLNNALLDFINEGCMQEFLYDDLVERNVKLDFGMNPNIDLANYNPNNKSLKFRNYSSITSGNLKEEFFHSFQDAYYPGGTSQYMNTGRENIEFEAKVFKDIITGLNEFGPFTAFFSIDNDEVSQDYYSWIYSVINNPSILQDENEYNSTYSSPKSDNFSFFDGLYYLINMSNCF